MSTEPERNEHGVILASYDGAGTLRWEDSSEAGCTFSAFQCQNGDVVIWCATTESARMMPLETAEALIGTTHDGRSVKARGLFEINYLGPVVNAKAGPRAYKADVLGVVSGATSLSTWSRFALTNVELPTVQSLVPHPLSQWTNLRQADGYAKRMRRLTTIKDIDVTAYLDVHAVDIDARESVAGDICALLSISRGTKVQWVWRVDHDANGVQLHWHHASHVTKAYCPLPAIDPRFPGDMERFLSAALPQYLVNKERWGLMTGLVDAYLDAKAENDYLEIRGIKLATVMEMLKESFVRATRQPQHARDSGEFDALVPELERVVRGVLRRHEWQEHERAIVYGNLRGLNQIPFRDRLVALCQHLDLSLPRNEIDLFVRCRNSLVHGGRFYADSATDTERASSIPPHATADQEHYWLVSVLDRIFLRLVGYRGPYVDWSDVENPGRKDTF